jgi:hypothetical protein
MIEISDSSRRGSLSLIVFNLRSHVAKGAVQVHYFHQIKVLDMAKTLYIIHYPRKIYIYFLLTAA